MTGVGTKRNRCAAIVAACTLATVTLWARQNGTGVQVRAVSALRIAGIVVDAATGAGIEGAMVVATEQGGKQRARISDRNGRFALTGLSGALTNITAIKGGYVGGHLGVPFPVLDPAVRPRDLELQRSPAESVVELRLWRTGAISGEVGGRVNRRGRDAVRVAAFRRTKINGYERLKLERAVDGTAGVFRIQSLPPGEYYVLASGWAGPSAVFPRTTAGSGIRLEAGETRSNVVVSVPEVLSDSPKVRGRAEGLVTGESAMVELTRNTLTSLFADMPVATASISSDGTFDFGSVEAGRYILRVVSNRLVSDSLGILAAKEVEIKGPSTTLMIPVRSGARIVGTVLNSGSSEGLSFAQSTIRLQRADGLGIGIAASIRMAVGPEGRFVSPLLAPGDYQVLLGRGPAELVALSDVGRGSALRNEVVRVRNADVSVQASIVQRCSEITGTIVGQSPAGEAAVVYVFPAAPEAWVGFGEANPRFRTTWTTTGASYKICVPPGEYMVSARNSLLDEVWHSKGPLTQLARDGRRITVMGHRVSVDPIVLR